jgi:hypothetical protein
MVKIPAMTYLDLQKLEPLIWNATLRLELGRK